MGCDVYLFRKEYVSYDKETETDLVKQQKFWSVKSFKLGIAFAEIFGADVDWTLVGLDQFEKVCKQMISHGEDDCGEYPDGALKAVVEDLAQLDDETKHKSDWYITLDY